MEDNYEVIATATGGIEAEILRGMLEAAEIRVHLRRESAGSAFGLSVGPLGEVKVLVPVEQIEEANQVLEDYRRGHPDSDELDQG